MRELAKKYVLRKGIAYREVDGKVVVVDPRANRLITLNEVGSFIWENLEQATIRELVEAIVDCYDVTGAEAASDVAEFVTLLEERDLIQPLKS